MEKATGFKGSNKPATILHEVYYGRIYKVSSQQISYEVVCHSIGLWMQWICCSRYYLDIVIKLQNIYFDCDIVLQLLKLQTGP